VILFSSAPAHGRRTGGVSIALATLALALAGCGGDGPPQTVVVLPGAPAEIRGREPLPFCGEEDVQLGGAGADEEARRCLMERWRDGRRAELISTFRTPEGDPITEILRVLGPERLQVFQDRTRDRFGGPQRWIARICRGLDASPPGPGTAPGRLDASRCEHPPRLV
jgi:hypothetical protein